MTTASKVFCTAASVQRLSDANQPSFRLIAFRQSSTLFLLVGNDDLVSSLLSLSSTEWSSDLEVVGYISTLVLSVEFEVVLGALFGLRLDIKVLVVVPADGLAFDRVECVVFLINEFLEASLGLLHPRHVGLRVQDPQQLVVVLVDVQLHWMLVVSEQGIVPVCQIGEGTTLVTS